MSNRKDLKLLGEVFDECASANECTGIFQRIILDPAEVRKFHEEYNDIKPEE